MWCQWMASSTPHPPGAWTSLLGGFLITYSHYCYCLAYKTHPLNVTSLEYKSDDVTLRTQNHYILERNPKCLPQAVLSSGSSSHLQSHLELLYLSFRASTGLPPNAPTSFYLICVCFFLTEAIFPFSLLATCTHLKCHLLRWHPWSAFLLPLEPFSQWAVI